MSIGGVSIRHQICFGQNVGRSGLAREERHLSKVFPWSYGSQQSRPATSTSNRAFQHRATARGMTSWPTSYHAVIPVKRITRVRRRTMGYHRRRCSSVNPANRTMWYAGPRTPSVRDHGGPLRWVLLTGWIGTWRLSGAEPHQGPPPLRLPERATPAVECRAVRYQMERSWR